ncbi:unnamed protein product [Arctia plantaginis]|uniref:BESS domain-containing protein n=1 Tax=Arctia plantaginis TaxID=874455 RepID=A0A8S0ZRF3_ARCPL|nr:unnamed protein product [Arctia plantaginis]
MFLSKSCPASREELILRCRAFSKQHLEVSSQEIPIESAALAEEEKGVEDSDLGQPSTSQTPKPLTSRRRPATDIAERQMYSALGQLTNILSKRQKENQPPPKEEDDCELYAKFLAKKLRELPPDDRKLMMYDMDTLFVNRIKEKQMRQTLSSYHSVPYQMQIASPRVKRPSTSQTSYTEPSANTSPYLNCPSPSPTSYSEPTISFSDQPATSHSESLLVKSSTQNQPSNPQTSIQPNYITQPDYSTPTIHIISNELIVPQRGQNLINQALLKAYEDFSNCEK